VKEKTKTMSFAAAYGHAEGVIYALNGDTLTRALKLFELLWTHIPEKVRMKEIEVPANVLEGKS
jgi:hypothetical protein